MAESLIQQPLKQAPVHPAAVGVNTAATDKAQMTSVLRQAQRDIGRQLESFERMRTHYRIVLRRKNRRVDADLIDHRLG